MKLKRIYEELTQSPEKLPSDNELKQLYPNILDAADRRLQYRRDEYRKGEEITRKHYDDTEKREKEIDVEMMLDRERRFKEKGQEERSAAKKEISDLTSTREMEQLRLELSGEISDMVNKSLNSDKLFYNELLDLIAKYPELKSSNTKGAKIVTADAPFLKDMPTVEKFKLK